MKALGLPKEILMRQGFSIFMCLGNRYQDKADEYHAGKLSEQDLPALALALGKDKDRGDAFIKDWKEQPTGSKEAINVCDFPLESATARFDDAIQLKGLVNKE